MSDTPTMRRSESPSPGELDELDAAARELALDPEQSILLEAPAGSGKTTVLTRRFLRLLCTVDEPEQILAITFTRKAAGEMRERILRALRGEAGGTDRESGALAAAALAHSRARGWSLELHPGRLRIQTIDSLNRWLAAQLPLAARGAGEAEVMEDPDALYRRAARRALLDAESDERLQADAERLFERLDNDFGRFERLLTDMLRVRGHWLPVLLGAAARHAPLHTRGAELPARVEESLRAIIAERLRRAGDVVSGPLVAEGARLASEAAQRRAAGGSEASARTRVESDVHATAGSSSLAGGFEADGSSAAPWRAWLAPPDAGAPLELGHWQGLAQLALTAGGHWRRALTKREGFPAGEKGLKARALDWIGAMSRVEGARELLAEIASLPEAALDADDAAALASLARVLQLAASELAVVFAESRRVDFPHVAAAARQALTEEGAPSDLALRLGSDIRHILVDEFQDTSIEQLRLLEALTAGWEEGDGRTLFVVGDPMQSIYQFREAEVGLFLRAGTHGIGRLPLRRLALTRNFRSRAQVVDWLNETFPRCFAPLDDPRASAVRYRPCTAGRAEGPPGLPRGAAPARPGSAVHLHATAAGDPQAEAHAIVAEIRRMRASEPAATIAVLVASRAHAAPIAAALGGAGIPVAGVDLVALGALPAVRDLEALARALDHLADRTAWLAVLRAPWCGLTLSDLSTLLEGNSARTVWEAIHDEQRVGRLAADARMRLARTRAALEHGLEQRDRLDLASWVESVWLRLGGPAACRDDADLERAQAFLAQLAEWSAEPGWPGPLALAERLESLHAPQVTAAPDAVQIMTIHRAKGLEFDRVIVPGLARRLRANAEPLLRWLELPRDPAGTDLLMAAIPPPWARGDAVLTGYLKSLAARRSANERVRLVYVAATRARAELHLYAEVPRAGTPGGEAAPPAGTLLASLWPAVGADLQARTEVSDEAAQFRTAGSGPADEGGSMRSPRPPLMRLTADWTLPPLLHGPDTRSVALDPEQEDAEGGRGDPGSLVLLERDDDVLPRAAAQAVCDQLRRCARTGRLPAPGSAALARALRERLSRMGLGGEDLEEGTRRALAAFDACLADPDLQWIFSSAQRSAESPCRLSGLHDGRLTTVTVDRAFVDETGARWLIRFEARGAQTPPHGSGEAERQWLETLRGLARALGSQPVRAGIYDTAARTLREIRSSAAATEGAPAA